MKNRTDTHTRTRLTPDDRREQLLDAGQCLFGQHAYDDVSLSQISERAGVSRPLIQHYFGNKASLYEAVFARAFAQMRVLLIPDTPVLDADSARAVMHDYFAFTASHPAGTLVAAGAALGGTSRIGTLVGDFIGDITDSILARLPDAARTDTMRAALSAWSYTNIGLTLQMAEDPKLSVEWAADHATTMLFATIAAQSGK